MNIIRKYGKESKHQWWRIFISDKVIGKSNFKKLEGIEIQAYGFNSITDYSNSKIEILNNNYITYIGKSKKEVLSKEREMLELYYDLVLKDIESNEEWLLDQKKHYEMQKKFLESYFEIPELKQISLSRRLKKINK